MGAERIAEVVADYGCEGYADYRDLLKNADAEIVVVASASKSHPGHHPGGPA